MSTPITPLRFLTNQPGDETLESVNVPAVESVAEESTPPLRFAGPEIVWDWDPDDSIIESAALEGENGPPPPTVREVIALATRVVAAAADAKPPRDRRTRKKRRAK